jgi:hypothetical protein
VTWDDLAWVRQHWPGRILLKGILDVEDARLAAAAGADGIVVSNHGGRQLDGVAASADALPRIVDAVGDRLDVLMDGGVRSGLDVVKALALGASACMLGRAWGYAVAARGEAGVAHMLSMMKSRNGRRAGADRRHRCRGAGSRSAARRIAVAQAPTFHTRPAASGQAYFAVRTAARMPCIRASGVGGQPGMRTSTPTTLPIAPQLA